MNTYNSVDVIIPVKERFKLLLKALDSIQNQTIIPNNVWVIDDCSDENISNFPKYDFPINLLRNDFNKGPSYSCNIAAKASNSKYIAILETDDLWLPSKIEKQLIMASERDLDFVYCNYFFNQKRNNQKFSNNKKIIFDLLLKMWSCPNPSTFFFKRESFLSLNGFDENMIGTHDHDLWIRITQSNLKIDFIDECLVEIENYNPNQMSRDYKTRIKSINYFCKKHKNMIIKNKNKIFYKSYKKELLSRALIPGMKKVIKEKNIFGFFLILRYVLFSKIFYKRIKQTFFKG